MTELLKIDTKGTCLLCLRECDDDPPGLSSSTAFKMLLRYLKIDIMKLGHFSSTLNSPLLSGPDSVDISVILCNRCSSVTSQFLQLFQNFERIRMELDNCVGKVHEAIKEGMENGSRVSQYRERVQSNCDSNNSTNINVLDALNASIAETVRKEALEKCIRKRASSTPRVLISDVQVRIQSPKQTGTESPRVKIENIEILDRGVQSLKFFSTEGSGGISDETKMDNFNIQPPLGSLSDSISISHQYHHHLRQDSLETWDHDQLEIDEKVFSAPPVSVADDPQEEDESSTDDEIYQLSSEVYKPINCNRVMLANGNLKCLKCGEIFAIPGHFRRHYLQVHRKTSFKCVYCRKIFPKPPSLSSHVATAHTLLKFADHLPPNTTDQELKQAVKLLFPQKKKSSAKGKGSSCSESTSPLTLACPLPFCGTKCGSNIRAHLFQAHLDQVVEAIVQIRTSSKCIRKLASSTPTPRILSNDAKAKISSSEQAEGNGCVKMEKLSLGARSLSSPSSTCSSTKEDLLRQPATPNFSLYSENEPREEVDEADDDELCQMPAEVYEPINCNRAKLPNGKLKCLKCEKTFDGAGNFRKHYLLVHRKTSFKCVYCRKIYPRPYSLASHVATAHTLLKFADQLPHNTTDQELKQAVKLLMPRKIKGKRASFSKSSPSVTTACPLPLCGRKYGSNVKAHLFQAHLDQVAVTIDKMRANIISSAATSLEEDLAPILLERSTKPLDGIHGGLDHLGESQSQERIECYGEDIKPLVHEMHVLSEPILQLDQFPHEDGDVAFPPEDSEMKFGESYNLQLQEDMAIDMPIPTVDPLELDSNP